MHFESMLASLMLGHIWGGGGCQQHFGWINWMIFLDNKFFFFFNLIVTMEGEFGLESLNWKNHIVLVDL